MVRLPRLYPILDTATLERRGLDLTAAAGALLAAGARILQLRHKGHFHRTLFEAALQVGELCRQAGAAYLIDDRADVAALAGAGVHLGQTDLEPALVRGLLPPGAPIGFSTHNEAQLRAAAGYPVDYLALGPVFATGSKEKPDPALGVQEWARLRQLTPLPLVAIGGITRTNAYSVLGAGADSLAVIGDLYPEPATPAAVRARAEEWIQLLA